MSEKDNILKDIGSAEYKHGFLPQVADYESSDVGPS